MVLCAGLYNWCCEHVVSCTCCTYGVACRWCCVHVVHMVLCTCGFMYMSCMWYCVHLALCTHCTGGAVYMWNSVHIVQVVSWTCDVVHTLCRWCFVQVVLCTCCKYGTGLHVVLCACRTCCVVGMQYYVCALCSHGIVTGSFVMLYVVHVYVLCCIVYWV